MARAHGRTATSIWDDEDFIALPELQQRLYLFLISQPDLSHAGLIPLRVRRWAQKGPASTPKIIRDTLIALDKAHYVVVDFDTEELLIRTFVRNDGVYKQPKVMLRLREDAKQIASKRLRAAFLAELDRLPLDELSTNPSGIHRDGPSTRQQVEEVVDGLRSDFVADAGYPSEGVSDTPRVRAGAFPRPPTPVPLPPSPSHQPPAASPLSADAEREWFEKFWVAYGKKIDRAKAVKAFKSAVKKADPQTIVYAAYAHAEWHERAGTEARFIKHPTSWLNAEAWTDERPEPQPPQGASKPSTTDQRVREGLALAARLAERERNDEQRAIGQN